MQSLVSTNSGPSLWKGKFVKNSAKKLEWSIRIGNVCEMIDSFGSRENPRELVRALNLQGQAEILAPPSGKIFNQTLQRIPSFFFCKNTIWLHSEWMPIDFQLIWWNEIGFSPQPCQFHWPVFDWPINKVNSINEYDWIQRHWISSPTVIELPCAKDNKIFLCLFVKCSSGRRKRSREWDYAFRFTDQWMDWPRVSHIVSHSFF